MTSLLEDLPARVLPPAVVEGVGVVQWVLDDLLAGTGASAFDELTDEQLREALESWHRVEAGVGAVKLRLLALADRNGTARAAGAASTAEWASALTHQDGDDAHRQVALAGHLDGTCAATRTALGEGRISARHAEVIAEAQRRLPASLDTEQRGVRRTRPAGPGGDDVTTAAPVAARRALEAVGRDAAVVDAHEDALLCEDERAAYGKTRLSLHDNGDGTVSGHFTVPDLHGQLLRKVLESMTAPRRGRLGASPVQAGDRASAPTGTRRGGWRSASSSSTCPPTDCTARSPRPSLSSSTSARSTGQCGRRASTAGAASRRGRRAAWPAERASSRRCSAARPTCSISAGRSDCSARPSASPAG
jgi:hypothetical protein